MVCAAAADFSACRKSMAIARLRLQSFIHKSRALLPYSCSISLQSFHNNQRSPLNSHEDGSAAPLAVAANLTHARNFSPTSSVLQMPLKQSESVSSHAETFIPPQQHPSSPSEQAFSAAFGNSVRDPAAKDEIASLDPQALAREMNLCLGRENSVEAVKTFEEWKSKANPKTGERNIPNRALFNLYIHSRLRLGASYKELCTVVKEMEQANMPADLTVFNFLLRAVFRERDSSTAEALLMKMEQAGKEAQPDGDSYNLVVVICALDKKIDSALKHFQMMRHKGFEPSKMTIAEVLLAASRFYRTRAAVALLKDIKDVDKVPILVTLAELLVAAADVDDVECASLALDFIRQKPTGKLVPSLMFDEGTMLSVLSSAARKGDDSLADKVWDTLVRSLADQQHPSPALYHARIHAHSAAGNLKAAFCAVEDLQNAHGKFEDDAKDEIFSPFSSLRPLVVACSKCGAESLDAAYYLLEEIHSKENLQPLAFINCIILGCSNTWEIDRAYQTFQSIESVFGLRPNVHSYNALLAGLAKTKQTSEALKVYEHIQKAGMIPDFRTYMLLLDTHLANRDTKSAVDLLDTMLGAGQIPLQQSTLKVWKRCFQEGDNAGVSKIKNLNKKIGYPGYNRGENRIQLLFDLLKVKA